MKLKWSNLRYLSQLGFMGFVAWYSYTHMVSAPPRPGPIDSICPFGAIETLPTFIMKGTYLQRTADTNFVVLIAMLLAILAFGRAFCGWICPMGTVGEWLYKFRKLFIKKDIVIPVKLHKVLRYLRYVVLTLIIVMSTITVTLMFRVWDPYVNIFKFHEVELIGWISIGVIALASMFFERFFCLYMCPLGGVIHPVAKLSATGIVRDENVCTSCGTCDSVCPMKIPVSQQKKINRGECITCMSCLDNCPAPGSLDMKIGW